MRSLRLLPISLHAALAALLAVSAAAGCRSAGSESDRDREAAAQAQAKGTSSRAPFALGYRPAVTADDDAAKSDADRARARGEQAIAKAQDAVREAPDDAARYVALAEAFLVRKRETGDPALLGYARDALAAAAALAPRDVDVLTTQIYFQLDAHAFADAAAAAREVIAIDPARSTGYLLLSDALYELGDYEGAIAAVDAATERLPDLRSYSRIAILRWTNGDTEGAIEAMDAALGLANPDSLEPAAWCAVELGVMMWHAGKLPEAINAAKYAQRLVPGYRRAITLEAEALHAQGRSDEALARLTARPDGKGDGKGDGGKGDSGAAGADGALGPADLVLLADIHAQAGRAAEAERYIGLADKGAAHHPLPVALYYARHRVNLDRALELADKAVAERATIAHQDGHALVLLRLGRADEAAAEIDRALALGTPDARLHLHRGLIALARGDRETARAALADANRINPHADAMLAAELAAGVATDAKSGPLAAR